MIGFQNMFNLKAFAFAVAVLAAGNPSLAQAVSDQLIFPPANGNPDAKRIVLVAGDEEYRSEESMPMLGKLLSQKHGFHCTIVFSYSADGSYIDPNNQAGLRGLESLGDADLMIIGTRFRRPVIEEAAHVTEFLNAGKPVIGIRTATHAFNGQGDFGGDISFSKFGRLVLGEQWVNHHGRHKREGARGVIEPGKEEHPILNSVADVFALSDVYGVIHLTDADNILLRAAVTETLDPDSKNVAGSKNDPMQPFAWLHNYTGPNGTSGRSFCTTGGASVDFLSEDLRRLIVNASYYLTGRTVPDEADVEFVDPFKPSFYGFIREKDYWKNANMQPSDYGLGKVPRMPDPAGTPAWKIEDAKPEGESVPKASTSGPL
ncbi:MAG: hypothetical protein ACPGLY_12640 [Rubripirellula sp.]